MDSLTQLTLGAAVGEAVIGRKVGNKAILWGAVAGTLPDLDVFVPLGDVVKDFIYHRSASHSLFVLALVSPLLVWLIIKLHPATASLRNRWTLAIYLVFATHVLLDSFTAYGTQILWPFVTTPVSWSTIFIIDPTYTLPLLIGVIAALVSSRESDRGHRINRYALMFSTVYLAWTVGAKMVVERNVEEALMAQEISYNGVFTTPTPFNSLLWRTVVRNDSVYYEGYYSVFDDDNAILFRKYASEDLLLASLEENESAQRLTWFSKGFYSVRKEDDDLIISDLRMGAEPNYVFRFVVAEFDDTGLSSVEPQQLEPVRDWELLSKIWDRIWDQSVELAVAKD
ncbi:MAG: metal-dependent hydrolase [Pseudomonadota bacterium]